MTIYELGKRRAQPSDHIDSQASAYITEQGNTTFRDARFPRPVIRRLVSALAAMSAFLCLWTNPVTGDLTDALSNAARQAILRVAPSVVQIETLGGQERVEGFLVGTAPTTGVIVGADGYIVSSAFQFKHDPTAILVTLPDGSRRPARIVARDTSRMLVLLHVEADQPLSVPKSVPRDEIVAGQWAFAIGRTYDAGQPSISIGIISAVNRIWGRAVQTDAKTSPVNYGGPLVDLHGRVLGVIVPLSPDSTSEVAGADQYDGGIGFAIPLEDIFRVLPKMREGLDVAPGILGVTLTQRDLYTQEPPEIAYCPPRSPAAAAGLRKGDRITHVEQEPIQSQSDLKHALGPYNADEVVTVTALRGTEDIKVQVTLADKVAPYILPFLGVLPERQRGEETDRAVPRIRYIYADSPADVAGMQIGDHLRSLNGVELADWEAWRSELALIQPDESVALSIVRVGGDRQVEVVLGTTPTSVPTDLPASAGKPESDEFPAGALQRGWIELKLPTEPNKCFAYIPETSSGQPPWGVVVLAGPPGTVDKQQVIARWKTLCETANLMLLVPESADPRAWQKGETSVVRTFYNRLAQSYPVDPMRVVVFGELAGGSLAYRFAVEHRDMVRGLAVIDAAVPLGIQFRGNDPMERLEFYLVGFKGSRLFERVESVAKALVNEFKFPVVHRWLEGESRELTEEELMDVARWVDTLDRL